MAFYVFIYFKRAEMAEIGSRKLLVMNQENITIVKYRKIIRNHQQTEENPGLVSKAIYTFISVNYLSI